MVRHFELERVLARRVALGVRMSLRDIRLRSLSPPQSSPADFDLAMHRFIVTRRVLRTSAKPIADPQAVEGPFASG